MWGTLTDKLMSLLLRANLVGTRACEAGLGQRYTRPVKSQSSSQGPTSPRPATSGAGSRLPQANEPTVPDSGCGLQCRGADGAAEQLPDSRRWGGPQ